MFATRRVSQAAIVLAAAACLWLAPAAQAVYTTINPTAPSLNEASHEAIFEHAYGGDFTSVGGVSYTNGTVTAERVDDAFDQVYEGDTFDFLALGVFALYNQVFGIVPGDSGGTFETVFAVAGSGFAVTGSATDVQIDSDFRVARTGLGGTKTSQNTDNYNSRDHVVTYRVTGLPEQGDGAVYVVFFEDNSENLGPADFDYNDLVVQITHNSQHVPEPAAVGLTLAAGVVLMRRRRG